VTPLQDHGSRSRRRETARCGAYKRHELPTRSIPPPSGGRSDLTWPRGETPWGRGRRLWAALAPSREGGRGSEVRGGSLKGGSSRESRPAAAGMTQAVVNGLAEGGRLRSTQSRWSERLRSAGSRASGKRYMTAESEPIVTRGAGRARQKRGSSRKLGMTRLCGSRLVRSREKCKGASWPREGAAISARGTL